MDLERIEAVLGHALAVAADSDDWRRHELGPIHLLKYLYLADLAYAKRHAGDSFIGTTWTFHNFGPWSPAAHAQLEPALSRLGAERRTFPSRYQDAEAVRWRLSRDIVREPSAHLPIEVKAPLAKAVKTFGDDTNGLLHHVYRTWPMLTAAPGDVLDLAPPPVEEVNLGSEEDRQKISRRRIKELRELATRRLEQRRNRRRLHPPDPPPRYDSLWDSAMAQLEPPTETGEGTLQFAESVWRSPARRDPDVS